MPKTGLLTTGAIALTIVLSACGGAQAATHAVHTHAASTPTAVQTLTVTQTAQDVLATWYADGGQVTVATIQADLSAISTDAGNYDAAAVEADGTQLASDADTAMMNGPDPRTGVATAWTEAMGDYSMSGQFAAAGDFADATTQMTAGTAYINDITALLG
jgi:hypothetical protein